MTIFRHSPTDRFILSDYKTTEVFGSLVQWISPELSLNKDFAHFEPQAGADLDRFRFVSLTIVLNSN